MNERVTQYGFKVAEPLYDFINRDVLPGIDINEQTFWQSLADILTEFMPANKKLLAKRASLQQQIDQWHQDKNNQPFEQANYRQFLQEIGYIVEEKQDFLIETTNVDTEITTIAGPQLVVPLMNARFALNAANARWGSLYDSLYGTDAIEQISGAEITEQHNPVRGARVIKFVREFFDQSIPLSTGSHSKAVQYQVKEQQLLVTLSDGTKTGLADVAQFVGYNGNSTAPSAILCRNNGLHIEIQIDKEHFMGKADAAGICDVLMEAAISTIQDCEDSIAAVDASDKVAVYRNWLGLMRGDLTETVEKNGKVFTRKLNPDRQYIDAQGNNFSLSGRGLQFIRNVGLLMTTDAILTAENAEVAECILDDVINSLIALHDLKGNSNYQNSRTGSIYIVKPKMHGPEEVAFSCNLFTRIEQQLNLAANTIKIGIMDEERRTSVNLKECIRVAKQRLVFINTGFLDRTGDEIHTSMHAGPVVLKEAMKDEKWIQAYENRNVMIGLKAGLKGKAQIGKGMWAVPDNMAAMLKEKITHLQAGASCAWVPSPTAAVLHALHYHQVNVSEVQTRLLKIAKQDKPSKDNVNELLTIPLLPEPLELNLTGIQNELDNNIQGLLGYVVRWIDQGVGCSKVPDINDVGCMEDRATLRISSQHICNWLHHGILDEKQIMASLQRMAVIVDQQNADDKNYHNMAPDFDKSFAFQAATDLVFKGKEQPSGYTEPLLHQTRRLVKSH